MTHGAQEGGPPAKPQWPAARVVARLPGSLPLGGVVQDTPVHGFAEPPQALKFARAGSVASPQATRHEIDLGGLLAFEIRSLITAAEADALITARINVMFEDARLPGLLRSLRAD